MSVTMHQPQPQYRPQAPRAVPPEERPAHVLKRLREIRGELHTATYPTIVRDRLKETLDLIEFWVTGAVSSTQPNIAPGLPPSDPFATRVEFVQSMPSQPVRTGDVNFIPGPPPGTPVVGQEVEFYNGPAHPAQQPGGQRVEFFGAPPQPQMVTSPATGAIIPNGPTHTVEAGEVIPMAGGNGAVPVMPIPVQG